MQIKIDAKIFELSKLPYNLFTIDLRSAGHLFGETKIRNSDKSLAYELKYTWLFSIFLMKFHKNIVSIGFTCRKGKIEGLFEPEEALLEGLSFKDLEFDTIIQSKDGGKLPYRKIQIVRFVNQNITTTDGLLQFLTVKKLKRYNTDDSLYLLIILEEAMRLEYSALSKLLAGLNVPFANVFAIGHTGPSESLEYFAIKLHPKVEGPEIIDFAILREK
jgi:hypothetical protein